MTDRDDENTGPWWRHAEYLTTAHAAEYLGYRGTSAIRNLIERGELVPDGRRGKNGPYVFRRSTLDAWVKGCLEEAEKDSSKTSKPKKTKTSKKPKKTTARKKEPSTSALSKPRKKPASRPEPAASPATNPPAVDQAEPQPGPPLEPKPVAEELRARLKRALDG